MQKRTLKRTLESLNLELVGYDNGTGNAINIRLKAPDGTTNKFMISRLDHPDSDRANITQMKHFAAKHSRSHTLEGFEVVDVCDITPKPASAVEVATRAVADAHSPEFLKYVKRKLEHNGTPIDVNTVLVAAASMPDDEPQPENEPVTTPSLTIAKTDMPKTKPAGVITMTKTSAKTTAKPKATKPGRMGQVEFFKLCNVLNEMDMIGIDSLPKLAAKLAKAAGREVSTGTAKDALEATGKKLDKVIVQATDAQQVIARVLMSLLLKLSEPVPDELRKLCGEIE